MEPQSAKPPHQKLQNDAAGIDADFGSIYVIPAPTDYMDDDVGRYEQHLLPHQLINFGPTKEKVLIIPDYRVTHVVPGVSRKPLIQSDQMVKLEKQKEEATSSSAPGAVEASNPPVDLLSLLSMDFREKKQVEPQSPLTALARFEGGEGAVLLDMFASWNVTTLAALPSFPSQQPEGTQLLIETGMFADIVQFAQHVEALLKNPPAVQPPSADPTSPSSSPPKADPSTPPTDLGQSRTYHEPAAPLAPTKPIMVMDVPGATPALVQVLSRYALIQTAQELTQLPLEYPGIYGMLKDAGEVPNIDELIAAAHLRLSTSVTIDSPPAPSPLPLDSSSYIKHLGEAQRHNVPIQDVSKNTLVGALKGMSYDLASELSTQYPPVHTLQALATFAEVSPTEFSYLKRKYPQLPDLCQEAALLVSIATGHPRPSSL